MLKRRRARRPRASTMTVTVPAPVGGLNTRDSLNLMPPTDAVRLDNWNPGISALSVREGFQPLVSGIAAGPVETLAAFQAGTVHKLVAAAAGGLYEISAAPALLASGFADDRWQSVNFNCQSALKFDPLSACNIDPPEWHGGGCPGSQQGGPARLRVALCATRSEAAWGVPVGPPGQPGRGDGRRRTMNGS